MNSMKKTRELKNKSVEELQSDMSEKTEQLRVFRFNIAGSKTKNVRQGRSLRKNIARIKTFINQHGKSN